MAYMKKKTPITQKTINRVANKMVGGAITGGVGAKRNSAVKGAVKGVTTGGLVAKKKLETGITATKANRTKKK